MGDSGSPLHSEISDRPPEPEDPSNINNSQFGNVPSPASKLRVDIGWTAIAPRPSGKIERLLSILAHLLPSPMTS